MTIIANLNSYGRFGNKFIFYLNMRSISNFLNQEWFITDSWEGDFLFNNVKKASSNFKKESVMLTGQDLLKIKKDNLLAMANKYNIILKSPLLGEVFFTFCEDAKIFLKEKIKQEKQVGIHFRGTDFKAWNPKSILPSEYYINALEWIQDKNNNMDIKYRIFTDDMTLKSINKTIDYLNDKGLPWSFGPNYNDKNYTKNFIDDFISLSKSLYIISSPSTFCISAGMISDSKIIHSKLWINSRVEEKDKFWVDLYNKGNTSYNIHKLI